MRSSSLEVGRDASQDLAATSARDGMPTIGDLPKDMALCEESAREQAEQVDFCEQLN